MYVCASDDSSFLKTKCSLLLLGFHPWILTHISCQWRNVHSRNQNTEPSEHLYHSRPHVLISVHVCSVFTVSDLTPWYERNSMTRAGLNISAVCFLFTLGIWVSSLRPFLGPPIVFILETGAEDIARCEKKKVFILQICIRFASKLNNINQM